MRTMLAEAMSSLRRGENFMTEAVAAVARIPKGDFSIEPVSVEAPRAGEVLVKIAGVGLCHTDLIFRDQFAPYALPAVLGHEGSGIIEALGEGVTGLAVGDKVVLGFSSCGDCPRCDEGLPSYCRSFVPLNYAGVRLEDGSTACCSGDERIGFTFLRAIVLRQPCHHPRAQRREGWRYRCSARIARPAGLRFPDRCRGRDALACLPCRFDHRHIRRRPGGAGGGDGCGHPGVQHDHPCRAHAGTARGGTGTGGDACHRPGYGRP
jgi:hypothetical protein